VNFTKHIGEGVPIEWFGELGYAVGLGSYSPDLLGTLLMKLLSRVLSVTNVK
jgi:hypothetical protein